MAKQVEYWLRGPVDGVPSLLQPAAHALLQMRDEAHARLDGFDSSRLWERPAGMASVGFHLQHIAGVLDRLFTYARDESLSENQLAQLKREVEPAEVRVAELLSRLDVAVDTALKQLRSTDPSTLTDARFVGRAKLPSTVQGLLFHAAEHSMRHLGQMIVTAAVVSNVDQAAR